MSLTWQFFWVNKNVFFGRISWDVERKVLARDFLVGLVWFGLSMEVVTVGFIMRHCEKVTPREVGDF